MDKPQILMEKMILTIISCYSTPTEMDITKRKLINVGRFREIRKLDIARWEYKMVQPLQKTALWFLRNSNNRLTYHQAKYLKMDIQTNDTPTFIVALFIIAKLQKQPKSPSRDE